MIKVITFIISLLIISNLHSQKCENVIYDSSKINRELNIEAFKVLDGFNLDVAERFDFCKAYYNGQDISSQVFASRVFRNNIELRIQNVNSINVRANDTIDLYFTDERKYIWDISGVKRIQISIEKEETPCDTISYIIYDRVKKEVNEIVTSEDVDIKQMYSLTLRNEIEQYIQTLNKEQKRSLSDCTDEYFILDYIEDDAEFGFVENDFQLSERIRAFLDIISLSINFYISQQNWKLSDFKILITGYADERSYTGNGELNFTDIRYIQNGTKIPMQNCNRLIFNDVHTTEIIQPLNKINNNCDLSIVRAFNAAKYFEYKFGEINNDNIEIYYTGKGEIQGSKYEKNRRIDIHLEIKSIAKKATTNNR
ncbi:hypothetical protein N9B82_02695 [Saprospiraceae bacterium]|nr:hypothetical protein [Saprospiraceae bacterium]